MSWINVKDNPPELDKKILLGYIKGKEFVMTQGYLTDDALRMATKRQPVETWNSYGYGLCFYDYAGRQIQSLEAKNSKNKVTHWRELLELPEN